LQIKAATIQTRKKGGELFALLKVNQNAVLWGFHYFIYYQRQDWFQPTGLEHNFVPTKDA